MLRKESKKYGNPRRKRLPKKEYDQCRPKPNRDTHVVRYDHNNRLIWKYGRNGPDPTEWLCPCCQKTTLPTEDYAVCWECQRGVCANCLADDEKCFGDFRTYICKKCLWKAIRWQNWATRTKFKKGFERPPEWRKVLNLSWSALKTITP